MAASGCGPVEARSVVSSARYRQDTTTPPRIPEGSSWIPHITITSAPAARAQWNKQLDKVRPIAGYDEAARTWSAHTGTLNLAGLGVLQTLFDTARTYGTEVLLAPVPVPKSWRGPDFTSDSEIAALVRAQTDEGRPLGHLPLARPSGPSRPVSVCAACRVRRL
ncbi:hypothetical protein OHB41_05850 [Streptomyces sp. NBC_01571]|uniref:hypothetical protein n=1 Tax=Streptomyces sp. NBC_01571 TaxID=2975883 RepID=UPI0022504957|nr:hypothetical protein [Streptomyces sp. NBC_01571]MCX4572707.1 hypothetical protein [Streptomyces sp. NBC_01571]